MGLQRLAHFVKQSFSSQLHVAAPAMSGFGTDRSVFARFFAGGYLDRNAVTDRILKAVKGFDKVDEKKVTTSSTFAELGLDSLDEVEVVMAMEEEFSLEIPDDDAEKIHSIEDAVDYFTNHPHAS